MCFTGVWLLFTSLSRDQSCECWCVWIFVVQDEEFLQRKDKAVRAVLDVLVSHCSIRHHIQQSYHTHKWLTQLLRLKCRRKKTDPSSWSVTFFFLLNINCQTCCCLAGSVQTSEEVQEAERRRRAAGRGVQSSLHSAGVRQVRLPLFKTSMLVIDFHLSWM